MKGPALISVFLLLLLHSPIHSFNVSGTFLLEPVLIVSNQAVHYSPAADYNIVVTRIIQTEDGKTLYYYINCNTLQYGLTDADFSEVSDRALSGMLAKLIARQSERSLAYGNKSDPLIGEPENPIFLTSDLCPTKRNLDTRFYDSIRKYTGKTGKPVPLIIFFSGEWLENHELDLQTLKDTRIMFIAGNHTYRHFIKKQDKNYPDLKGEILRTEVRMLRSGILPSFYFRFPGLKYTKAEIDTLAELNMVAFDANVWMGAKGRKTGVLLVHSNGVVPVEVGLFVSWMDKYMLGEKQIYQFIDIFEYFKNW